MNNYEFCADWVSRHVGPEAKVLDYGCGGAQIVTLLRSRGIDAYGCDLFYEGGDLSGDIAPQTRPYVSRMEHHRIPFPDGYFDCLVSNQVFEHVEDIDLAVAETARVLKPGGWALHIFPARGTWREGHIAVPFVHWFPKGSTARVYYTAAVRALGFGVTHDEHRGLSSLAWARECCRWLDEWTHYRSISEIHRAFSVRFAVSHIESEWVALRFPRLTSAPVPARTMAARVWGGTAIELKRA